MSVDNRSTTSSIYSIVFFQSANPYIVKLSILDDELALNVSTRITFMHTSNLPQYSHQDYVKWGAFIHCKHVTRQNWGKLHTPNILMSNLTRAYCEFALIFIQ